MTPAARPSGRARRARAAMAGAVGLAAWAEGAVPIARAEPCGRPDIVDMVPPDGARDVPVNAVLSAHYAASAEYLGEDVLLLRSSGEGQVLPATFDSAEGRLSVTPTEPLTPGDSYVIRWPGLRGLNVGSPGLGDEARFMVGSVADTTAPVFDGVADVEWDVERRQSDCTESIEERMIFDLELATATDDGGSAGLTLLVFQTAGPGAAGGRSVPVLARAWPTDRGPVRVGLTTEDAVGEICFAALARDTTERVSQSGAQEVCVQTTAPPFFRSCGLAPDGGAGGRGGGSAAGAAAVLALALTTSRRRRART